MEAGGAAFREAGLSGGGIAPHMMGEPRQAGKLFLGAAIRGPGDLEDPRVAAKAQRAALKSEARIPKPEGRPKPESRRRSDRTGCRPVGAIVDLAPE